MNKRIPTLDEFINENLNEGNDLIVLKNRMKDDQEVYDTLKLLNDEGIYASSGGRDFLTDIIVDYKNKKKAIDILKKNKIEVKESINLNEGGIHSDAIADKVYSDLGRKYSKDWETKARKILQKYHLSKDWETEILSLLAGEDYFDTGDVFMENRVNEKSVKDKVIELYKKGKSQAEISDMLKLDINTVAGYTKHLGIHVGKSDYDDERFGDDPSSKQYYGRTIKNK